MKWHLLHPIAVHFPIALLTAGLVMEIMSIRAKDNPKRNWLAPASMWLLLIGSVSAWAAFGLGQLAEEFVEHVPDAWEVLEHHETLAYWSAGLFTALGAWRIYTKNWWESGVFDKRRWIFTAAWILALGVLFWTALHGGLLVFKYGVGVELPGYD